MEYLTQEDVMAEFYARTLFIPGHLGLAEKGVDFQTDLPQAKQALGDLGHKDGPVGQAPWRVRRQDGLGLGDGRREQPERQGGADHDGRPPR